MNTCDIFYNGEIKNFEELYGLAKKQFVQYEKIEGIDWKNYVFCLDHPDDQSKIKDMFQIRAIEEITEASLCLEESGEHFWEEIGDFINFFLSGVIMIKKDFSEFTSPNFLLNSKSMKKVPTKDFFAKEAYEVIEGIGSLCNLLKNRPWSESNYMVSILDFDLRLKDLWNKFWFFLKKLGLSAEDVFEIFWKKYKVNEYRRETHY